MSSSQASQKDVRVTVENIGGIRHTDVSFTPGITILAGRNATNRTSFLRSLMAALGSEDVNLRGDAEEGRVELEVEGERYYRTLERTNGSVRFGGEPYLAEPEAADLFAFLLESNDARRAVERGDDLYETVMRPVDTDEVESEIRRLEENKSAVESELERLHELESRLPDRRTDRSRLEADIERKQSQLEEKRAELDALGGSVDEERAEQSELDEKLDEISEARTSLERIRQDIQRERNSLDALEEEREELDEKLDAQSDSPEGDLERIENEIQRHRDERQSVVATINKLQTAIQFNDELLRGDDSELSHAIERYADADDSNSEDESVTDQLVSDGTEVVCWTCGRQTGTDQIEETIELLRTVRTETAEERSRLQERIDELGDERDDIKAARERRRETRRQRQEVTSEIETRRERIDSLEEERGRLEETVDRLEAEANRLESESQSELLDLHREANRIEFELSQLRSDLEDVETDIEDIEAELEAVDEVETRLDDVTAELEERRRHIEQIETDSVAEFNEQMETLLDLLGYENIERIWIETTEREVREGRRKVTQTAFDLHVVRETESGSVYEDTIDHLSESEREVVGLVLALAGYLVHDLHESMPFVLLDSLEALDSERIGTLVEYLENYVEYLVVALLPEDAAALDEAHQRVTDI